MIVLVSCLGVLKNLEEKKIVISYVDCEVIRYVFAFHDFYVYWQFVYGDANKQTNFLECCMSARVCKVFVSCDVLYVLFLIYIIDISNIFSESKTILFADDMTMYLTGPNPDQLIYNANNKCSNVQNVIP